MQPFPAGPVSVQVPVSEYALGYVPNICPLTGQPTAERMRWRFATTPPWALVGILFGVVGIVVTLLISQKSASGWLPLSTPAKQRIRARRMWGAGVLTAGLVLIALGITLASVSEPASSANSVSALMFLVGALALIAGLLMLLAARTALRLRHRVWDDPYGNRWLELGSVHPLFAHGLAVLAEQRRQGAMPPMTALPPGWPLAASPPGP